MAKERLLQRIRVWSVDDHAGQDESDLATYLGSLMRDISKLYNTRQGTVMLDPAFGIPEFTSMMTSMSPPEIETMRAAFLDVSLKYEPRLSSLNIQFEPRDSDRGLIRFVVSGKASYRDSYTPIGFDILLQGDGSIALQMHG